MLPIKISGKKYRNLAVAGYNENDDGISKKQIFYWKKADFRQNQKFR